MSRIDLQSPFFYWAFSLQSWCFETSYGEKEAGLTVKLHAHWPAYCWQVISQWTYSETRFIKMTLFLFIMAQNE